MKLRFSIAVGLLLLPGFEFAASADEPKPSTFDIVAYLPEYRISGFEPNSLEGVTDLICFSIEPRESGALDTSRIKPEMLETLGKACKQHGTRLAIALGGWARSNGFAKMAADAKARTKFISELTEYCLDHKLAGADFDWEHPQNDAEERSYALLLVQTQRAFRPHKLLVTAALAGWQNLPAAGFDALDRIHLMAYDHDDARHSTLAIAESDVGRMLARDGVKAGQLCLGLPCYGRKLDDRNQVMTYAEIIRTQKPAPDADEAGGWYFNGVGTIRAKTRFAQTSKLRGVML